MTLLIDLMRKSRGDLFCVFTLFLAPVPSFKGQILLKIPIKKKNIKKFLLIGKVRLGCDGPFLLQPSQFKNGHQGVAMHQLASLFCRQIRKYLLKNFSKV